jgi:hypothetical protein
MTTDPLRAARGITLGMFCGIAMFAFMLGAVFAMTGDEQAGAVCMIVACGASVLAIITGANNAQS